MGPVLAHPLVLLVVDGGGRRVVAVLVTCRGKWLWRVLIRETYSPVKIWLVGEEAVEVEGAGTARTPASSCFLLNSGLPAQAAEVEVHIDHTLLRTYRTDNNHRHRARKLGHSAAAEEGAADTDRMQ